MSMRLIETVAAPAENSTALAKVYRDSERQEFRVKFYRGGKHVTAADYHTDDKDDAISTAKAELRRMTGAAPARSNNIKPSHKRKPTPKPRTLGSPSQRARKTATGETKKPSARLMAWRQKDTIPGYYPNPVQHGTLRAELLKEAQRLASSQEALRASKPYREIYAAYIEGILYAGVIAGVISTGEYDSTAALLVKSWNLD